MIYEPDPRVDCTCGQHFFRWSDRKWYFVTPAGMEECSSARTCMKDRGPEYQKK